MGRTYRKEASLERRANKRVYRVKRNRKFYQNTYYSDEEKIIEKEEILLTAKRNEDAKDI